ncbi:GCN5 family acetyltransferase [Streptomyces sp. AcH 505]|uniref:GNAT family N-acetyltransferase n=1 Tax=Streptomyces sp. AcH 505 TaxID=352211 RepID=UPI0005919C65|nr:GCN5 family acetyltransferase [Streptomyces sp. AcH 505]
MRIRPAAPADLPLLQDIEVAAGEPFRTVGMALVADDTPPSLHVLERYRADGLLWVTDDGSGAPVAYVIHEEVDGAGHVEQVSVHPAAAHRRLGSALIDHVGQLAKDAGLPALTLTTFAEVPWNAPYYARLGFRTLGADELTDGLREIRRAEAEHGLDAWPRVCMRREL